MGRGRQANPGRRTYRRDHPKSKQSALLLAISWIVKFIWLLLSQPVLILVLPWPKLTTVEVDLIDVIYEGKRQPFLQMWSIYSSPWRAKRPKWIAPKFWKHRVFPVRTEKECLFIVCTMHLCSFFYHLSLLAHLISFCVTWKDDTKQDHLRMNVAPDQNSHLRSADPFRL